MAQENAGSEGPRGQQQTSTRYLLLIGLAGPIVFLVVIFMLGFLDSSHNLISDPISMLGHADAQYPYVLRANYIVLGVSVLAFTLGVARKFRDGWHLNIAILLFIFLGIGAAAQGMFPASEESMIEMGHALSGVLTIFAALIGIPLMSWLFHSTVDYPGYRSQWTVVAITVLIVVSLAIQLLPKLFLGETNFDGILTYPNVIVITGWVAYHSFRLYRVTTEQ